MMPPIRSPSPPVDDDGAVPVQRHVVTLLEKVMLKRNMKKRQNRFKLILTCIRIKKEIID